MWTKTFPNFRDNFYCRSIDDYDREVYSSGRRQSIINGSDLTKNEDLAKNSVYKAAKNTLISAAFWPDFSILPTNDYNKFPYLKALDNEIISHLYWQFKEFGYIDSFIETQKALTEDCLDYGFSMAFPLWGKKNGWRVIEDFLIIPPYNFDFQKWPLSDFIWYIMHTPTGIRFCLDDCIYYNWPRFKHGNYYGISEIYYLEPLITILELLDELRARGMSRVMIKPVIHYTNKTRRSRQDYDNANISVEGLESGVTIHLPMSIDPSKSTPYQKDDLIEVMDPQAEPTAVKEIKDLSDTFEKRINRFMGTTDSLGASNVAFGSYAKADVEYDIFVSKATMLNEWEVQRINKQIIYRIIKYNFTVPPEYKNPTAHFGPIEEEYSKPEWSQIKEAVDIGTLQANEPWIRERMGWPSHENISMKSDVNVLDSKLMEKQFAQYSK